MRLGSCPNCGNRQIRAGSTYLRHLARVALGSKRRYCGSCRSRWIAPNKAFSPWAILAGALPIFSAVALALVYLTHKTFFSPYSNRYGIAGPENAWTGPSGNAMAGGMQPLQETDGIGSSGRDGARITRQNYGPLRWKAGQGTAQNAAYLRNIQWAEPQNGQSHNIQEILRQVAVIVKNMGKTPRQFAREIEQTDKQTLWNKYGNNFASKEDAQAAYEDFLRHRNEIPKDWPSSDR